MVANPNLALLVVAFARAEGVSKIINTAVSFGISRVYISVDGAGPNQMVRAEQEKMLKIIADFENSTEVSLFLVKRELNIGCSANVLSSIDWVFEHEENVIILEDDCIPTKDFFQFVSEAISILEHDQRIWLLGGTQVLTNLELPDVFLSKYPITWGWATTKGKWHEIRTALLDLESKYSNYGNMGLSIVENSYWRSGSRRSYSGMIDVWDIPLAMALLAKEKFCLLPSQSLVMNVGDDGFALHTNSNSSGMRKKTGVFTGIGNSVTVSESYAKELKRTQYKIRNYHLLSNKLRAVLDFLFVLVNGSPRKPLVERWKNARIEIS
jgi:hypothetical protein